MKKRIGFWRFSDYSNANPEPNQVGTTLAILSRQNAQAHRIEDSKILRLSVGVFFLAGGHCREIFA